MRAVLFAYHEVGTVGLEQVLGARFDVPLVVTHADDAGEEIWFRSVAKLAREHSIPCVTPASARGPDLLARVAALAPDFIFSFYYRKLLSRDLLALARRGALNLHGSLLPEYRGRCPVNWVLVNGETRTGVSLHYMDEKADHGDLVAQRVIPISKDDTARTLYAKVVAAAGALLGETLPLLAAGTAPRTPQDHAKATTFGGRSPDDGKISWDWPAARVYDLVRAVTHPYPGAFATWRGRKMLVWWGVEAPGAAEPPGTLRRVDGVLSIATGAGRFAPRRVQLEGEPECEFEDVARAMEARDGEVLA